MGRPNMRARTHAHARARTRTHARTHISHLLHRKKRMGENSTYYTYIQRLCPILPNSLRSEGPKLPYPTKCFIHTRTCIIKIQIAEIRGIRRFFESSYPQGYFFYETLCTKFKVFYKPVLRGILVSPGLPRFRSSVCMSVYMSVRKLPVTVFLGLRPEIRYTPVYLRKN